MTGQHSSQASSDSDVFAKIFQEMLNHKVRHGDLSFPDSQPDMTQRLTYLATCAFNLYRTLHGTPSRTETSSSHTGGSQDPVSLLGGSSTHASLPTQLTSLSQPLSVASVSTATTTTQPQLQGQ